MKSLVVIVLICACPFVFLVVLIEEQKHAIQLAWLESFGDLPRVIRKVIS